MLAPCCAAATATTFTTTFTAIVTVTATTIFGKAANYIYHKAQNNPNTLINKFILKLNSETFVLTFSVGGLALSSGIMSTAIYLFGDDFKNYVWPSYHDESSSSMDVLQQKKDYVPFSLIKDDWVDLPQIPTGRIMVDNDPNNNLLVASPEGSKIFSKGGLNYLIGNNEKDEFFFSMCSTKAYNGKTNVIAEFEDNKDKINLFCSKRTIEKQDIHIYYNQDYNTTFLTISNNPSGEIAIAVLGEHPGLLDDVYLNQKWVAEAY